MNKIDNIINNNNLGLKPLKNFPSIKPLQILISEAILRRINNTKAENVPFDVKKVRIQHIDWREDLVRLWGLDSVDVVNIILDIEEKIEIHNPDLIFNLTNRQDFVFTSPTDLIYYMNEIFYNLEKEYPEINIKIKEQDNLDINLCRQKINYTTNQIVEYVKILEEVKNNSLSKNQVDIMRSLEEAIINDRIRDIEKYTKEDLEIDQKNN